MLNIHESFSCYYAVPTRLVGNLLFGIRSLTRNPNLNHLVEASFQGGNIRFVLAFEDNTQRTSRSGYYLPNGGLTDCNIMINGKNIFDQPIKNNKTTYENIRKIVTGQGDDYTTG